MGKQRKKCRLCGIEQTKEAYAYQADKRGRLSYCQSCEERYKGFLFVHNQTGQVTRALTQKQADNELLKGTLIYQQGVYIENQQSPLTDSAQEFVLALGKYNEKRYRLEKEKAEQLVREAAGTWEGNVFRHRFARKELQEYVANRDKHRCHYCKGFGNKMTFLVSRSKGGLLSPTNSVCCCEACKEEHGEDMFFYKWLNIHVMETQERTEDAVDICDKRKQTHFLISRAVASQLVHEKMAIWIDRDHIQLNYTKKEFRQLILTRDNYTCRYCQDKGDTIEHVVPQASGGMTTPANCVVACASCNELKSDSSYEDFIEKSKNKSKINKKER